MCANKPNKKYSEEDECIKAKCGECRKVEESSNTRYNMVLYPRLESNLDWSPVDVYPGSEFFIYHNYQEDVSVQITSLKIARWIIIGTTLAKIGIHEYYENK